MASASITSMPLGELLNMPACVGADTPINGVELDSRNVTSGDLFLAVAGELFDGRQFIKQAVASGAAAIAAQPPVAGCIEGVAVPVIEISELGHAAGQLASRFYHYPSRALHMVGVTGTNGKTTTTRLIAQLSRLLEHRCGAIGTLGASLVDDVVESENTTPDAISVQRQLAQWRDADVFAASMEVSSHALVQGRVSGVEFDTAVFTNLSQDHLDYHPNMEAYGRAKLALFAVDGLRYAIINLDDAFATQVLEAVDSSVKVYCYSCLDQAADIHVYDAQYCEQGVRALIRTPWGSGKIVSPLRGDFNLSNLAAAIAAVVLSGESLSAVLGVVPQLQSVPGRMQAIENDLGLQVIVDYAHTPDALEKALLALRPGVNGKLITVFGCGGDRDQQKRSVMGSVASQLSDLVVVTSDNPRSEDPLAIAQDIVAGCTGTYQLELDRAQAIALAIDGASAGDCIVIAGKGHETYQVIKNESNYFSDAQQAIEALEQRAKS